jgi:Ku70/Ku80 beta-barrel domain
MGKPLEIVRSVRRTPICGKASAVCRNECARIVLNPQFPVAFGVPDGPRANWKGFLRLSLVTCPVALCPATSDSEKISFNQINRKTGHRIKYAKVDADTGEEVSNEDIMKSYKVDTDTYIEVSKDELEAPSTLTSSSPRAASTPATSSGRTTSCRTVRLGMTPLR